jgi:hypothetical protein
MLTHGSIPEGKCVLHACDNPGCVRPDHLYIGTVADNNRDARERGRWKHGGRKLTDEQILEIRSLPEPMNFTQVALSYGVHRTTISRARKGKAWAKV